MIPYEQLSEALARWCAERRGGKTGEGDVAAASNGQPEDAVDSEIEADEVIEPEPE